MSEGLEALKEMRDEAVSSICRYIPRQAHEEVTGYFDKRKSIIEKELKAYEQYKIFEEELGIDLIKFSKILFALDNETVYVKEMIYKQYDGYCCFEETGKVERHCIVRFSRAINGNRDWFFIIHFGYIPNEYLYRLQDYGKTWALNREELL